MRRRLGVAAATSCVALLAFACSKANKPRPPAVNGLQAVPASAQVVISIDVQATAQSQLVARAATKLLANDASLAERWARLRQACNIDPLAQKQVTLALGSAAAPVGPGSTTGAAGTAGSGSAATRSAAAAGPTAAPDGGKAVLMVVTGSLAEAEFTKCVRAMLGSGGGKLTASAIDGRTIYEVSEGTRRVYFGFGDANTVVLSGSQDFLQQGLGKGPKIESNPAFAARLQALDQGKASVWAIGTVDDRVGQGLIAATAGAVKAGPVAIMGKLTIQDGLAGDLRVELASESDAKALESYAKAQVALLSMAAQVGNLGPLVANAKVEATGNTLRLALAWTPQQVNQVLSVIDTGAVQQQTAPPPTDAAPN